MTSPLSLLGLVHTAISLAPVAAGLYSFVRHGLIVPSTRSGRIYLVGLVLSVLTSFGLSSTGGFNPGHALGILALVAVAASLLTPRLRFLGTLRPYLAAFGSSFSYFLLLVPGIAETLTRLPASQPLAQGSDSPVVRATLLGWTVLFVLGAALQAWTIWTRRAVRS
ncbi:MAG: hypothetical protein EOO29_14505 [Comamonadaceae bacterium]|nr:MAG: hypothetical protein EOO29_14505 [Comamonadaceae bacterium]